MSVSTLKQQSYLTTLVTSTVLIAWNAVVTITIILIMEEAMADRTRDKIQIILGIRTIDHNVKFTVSLDT